MHTLAEPQTQTQTPPPQKTGASLNRGGSRQDFPTPPDFIAAVEHRFGPLAWDLAASEENKKAPRFLSIADNSLVQPWHRLGGLLWLNPPFSAITPWVAKCAREALLGARIIMLVPASVGSNWFAEHVHPSAHVLALNGRITFVGHTQSYPKDCMLCCWNLGEPGFDVWRWGAKEKRSSENSVILPLNGDPRF